VLVKMAQPKLGNFFVFLHLVHISSHIYTI
jgi:hypothetical protein